MNRLTLDTAEDLARRMRIELRVANTEPLDMKTVVRQLNILTLYRPLSESLYGLSLKSPDDKNKFILVNSNSTRGRQHFTIAHELYHLYYDEKPTPHFCGEESGRDSAERSANMFASALLMPKDGLIQNIPAKELTGREISIEVALRLEYLFGVSNVTLAVRLKELKLITPDCAEYLKSLSIKREAAMRGYDSSLYSSGNEGLVIGDFGSIAKRLYDSEKISESHYLSLLNMIGYGEGKDRS